MTTYSTGTISVGAGSTTLTGVGTAWLTSGVRAGDMFMCAGLVVPIASINSNTSITLARAWPGAAQAAANYNIDFRDDGTRSLAAANQLLQQLTNGTLTSMAGLAGTANKLPYFSGQNVLALTDLTAAARALLDDANAAAMRFTLGIDEYGLGTTTRSFPGNDLSVTDNSVPTGFYQYNPNSMTGGPVSAWAQVIHMRRASGGGEFQIFCAESPSQYIWMRTRGTGAWSTWARTVSSLNAVGNVSQEGGIPTGGMFQRINNANGDAIRFADGTQICWAEVTATRINNYACRISATFPAVFVDTQARITCSLLPNTGVGYATTADERRYWGACGPVAITTSLVQIDAYNNFGAPNIPADATVKLHYHAYGRWY